MKILGLDISRTKKPAPVVERPAVRPRIAARSSFRPPRRAGGRSYDAAATGRHNINHWLYADSRDADSIIFNDLATLRNRCRYELRNKSYAKGMARTFSDDIIGRGPIPQFDSGNPDHDDEV